MSLKTILSHAVIVLSATAAQLPAHADGQPPGDEFDLQELLHQARRATAAYTDVDAAVAAGYVTFPDLHGDCVDQPGQGGMGVHYLNADLLDGELDPLLPEFLVYRPGKEGRFQLAALEYVVFAPLWDAQHPQPPVLFGHPMHLVRTPNRYGTEMPFYELHVWLWDHNPNGLFNDWNPTFSCQ